MKTKINIKTAGIAIMILFASWAFTSYGQTPKKTEVKVMNKNMYIKEVYDYDKNPDEYIFKSKRPAVIDFYADWCGPCRRIAPIMDELSITYKGKVDFYKVNVDFEKELASVHGVQSIPVVGFFPVNEGPQMVLGALPKDQYIKYIEEILIPKK